MDAIVQMVEEGSKKKDKHRDDDDEGQEEDEASRTVRNWVSIEQAGINFRGRFVPDNEFDPKSFSERLSPAAQVNFEAWLRETTTIAVNTEINVQLGEFTIKKHTAQPLDDEIRDHADFQSVFEDVTHDDIIQCAEVKHTTNRRWQRLVGLGYDVQMWVADDRLPVYGVVEQYSTVAAPQWLRDILEPWRTMILPNVELNIMSTNLQSAEIAHLYGFLPPEAEGQTATLKEVVVYRYPRVIHIYNIIEHGRRWYRSMVFSSDPVCTLHDLPTETFFVGNKLYQCGGNPVQKVEPAPSLVILRYHDEDVEHAQMYLPTRLLHGTMPSSLLQTYAFWQNADDSVTAYMPAKNTSHASRSILQIKLNKTEEADITGFGFAGAIASISRVFTLEDTEVKDFSFYTVPDPDKPVMYLVDLMKVLNHYQQRHVHHEASTDPPNVATEFVNFQDESQTLHALVRLMLRLEPLSQILAWSRVNPSSGTQVPVDLIELPRLRLSFERAVQSDGTVRYNCLEQSGCFLAACTEDLKFRRFLDGLPNSILLTNQDSEYSLLVPATVKPFLVKGKVKHSYKLTYSMMDKEWVKKTGDQTYFIYPIHSSDCFMASKSIASNMYLLAVRLMTRNYKEAYRLIESCVCDRVLTGQEQQIFNLISQNPDCLLADAFACRLKLFFVTYGCSEIMPFNFDLEEAVSEYVSMYRHVSACCRLTPDEEVFILSRIPPNSPIRTPAFTNRERILRCSFDLSYEKFVPRLHAKNFTPVYPKHKSEIAPYNAEKLDLELIDIEKANFKNVLQKLSFAKYTRQEPVSGPEAITFLLKVLGKQKNLGFFVLYDLMNNAVPVVIIPELETAHSVGSLLFRTLPDMFMSGLQRVILHIMETHPELSARMPQFEDKRTLKLPSFAGFDVFQTHIKSVCQFIKESRGELNVPKMLVNVPEPYSPQTIVTATDTLDEKDGGGDFLQGRTWLNPRILDFTCEARVLSHEMIPAQLETFRAHYTEGELSHLVNTPLNALDLSRFVEMKTRAECGESEVSAESPLRCLSHPSSRSHIARTSVTRLEDDIADFATDENVLALPVIKSVRASTVSEASGLEVAVADMFKLIQGLTKLRESDSSFAKEGTTELLFFCNGQHSCYDDNLIAQAHLIQQVALSETPLVSIQNFYKVLILGGIFFTVML